MPGPAAPGSGPDPEESYDFLFKLVLIGDASVGKTCLVQRFKTGAFAERQGSTIGVDFTMKSLEIQGKRVKVSGEAEGRPLPRAAVPARREELRGELRPARHGTALGCRRAARPAAGFPSPLRTYPSLRCCRAWRKGCAAPVPPSQTASGTRLNRAYILTYLTAVGPAV